MNMIVLADIVYFVYIVFCRYEGPAICHLRFGYYLGLGLILPAGQDAKPKVGLLGLLDPSNLTCWNTIPA